MKLRSVMLVGFVILIGILGFVFLSRNEQKLVPSTPPLSVNQSGPTVKIGNVTYEVEIRDDDAERMQGLSGRTSLGQNQGMLFIFPQKGTYAFWMKDMKFAIDMIWIDGDTIMDISENVPAPASGEPFPATRQPKVVINKVLEVNAGQAKNMQIGQKVIFDLD